MSDSPSRTSPAPSLAAALVAFQADITNVGKTSTARIQPKDQSKPAFSFPYADLPSVIEHVRPVLAKHKLAVLQNVETDETLISVWTIIVHESGESMTLGPISLPAGADNKQAGGSITSARRFALMASLGISAAGEDAGDDAGGRRALVTSRQLAKIAAEVERGKVQPEELTKVLSRYRATGVDELTVAQASDLIDRLIDEADRRAAASAAGADPKTGEVPA